MPHSDLNIRAAEILQRPVEEVRCLVIPADPYASFQQSIYAVQVWVPAEDAWVTIARSRYGWDVAFRELRERRARTGVA